MTRKDCEKKIKDKMVEIWKLYQKYNPGGGYLEMHLMVCDDGVKAIAHNSDWDDDQHHPLRFEERNV